MRAISLVMVVGACILASCAGGGDVKHSPATATATPGAFVCNFEAPRWPAGDVAAAGWQPGETKGTGTPAQWVVVSEAGAPSASQVLAVRTQNTEATFNQCILAASAAVPPLRDGSLSAMIKPVSGVDDQGGGLMFRVKDHGNYLLTRWNPLEHNVRLYFVKDGKRTTLDDATVETTPGWHKLGVTLNGADISVLFDDKVIMTSKTTEFGDAGLVGLWTKSDASSLFDDVRVSW